MSSRGDSPLVPPRNSSYHGTPNVLPRLFNHMLAISLQAGTIAGSFFTSRMLMMEALKDHPLCLLFLHVSLLWLIQTYWRTHPRQAFASPATQSIQHIGALWLLVLVPTTCICLVSAYKVLRFAGSASTASMLLSLHFSAHAYRRRPASRAREIISVVTRGTIFAIGYAFVLVWDYRVNITSRDMSSAFLISSHVLIYAPAIIVALHNMPGMPRTSSKAVPRLTARCHWPSCVLLPLAVVIYIDEASKPFVGTIATRDCMLLLANLVFTMVACILSQYAPTSESVTLGDLTSSSTTSILVNRDCWARLVFPGFVVLGAWLSNDPLVMISSWQVAGYVTALAASRSALFQITHSFGTGDVTTKQSSITALCRRASYLRSGVFLALSVWLLCACTVLLKPTRPKYDRPGVDGPDLPSADFDIVVAAYARPGIEIAHDVHDIMSLQALGSRTTNIYIYDKGPEVSELEPDIRRYLQNASALHITRLDNTGREGGTYLHHIVSEWNRLARHTLFIQEQAHDFALLKQRIADYLVLDTGFMSLSYEGKTWKQCDHLRAGAWIGVTESICRISRMINSNHSCGDLSLTFRGQFIVSDTRIRSNSKSMYAGLLHDLQDAGSWIHSPAMMQSPWNNARQDSVEDPTFGYTLERLWGFIMHCSDKDVADRNPSLLGSYIRSVWFGQRFPSRDVQCLDDDSKDL